MSKVLKVITILSILLFAGTLVIYFGKANRKQKEILSMGLTKGQDEYFQQQLRETGKQFGYIQKGYSYLRKGEFDSAIDMFETALKNAYSPATEGEAIVGLANTYEKRRDYAKALEYMILSRDKYVADWAREPRIERVKYLEYALKGKYGLAIQHAKKAIEAHNKITSIKTNPSQDYIDRLNDLIAAKSYIESLKKK